MVMIRHHARGVDFNAGLRCGPGETVEVDLVGLVGRTQPKCALGAAPCDHAGCSGDNASRAGHSRACSQRACHSWGLRFRRSPPRRSWRPSITSWRPSKTSWRRQATRYGLALAAPGYQVRVSGKVSRVSRVSPGHQVRVSAPAECERAVPAHPNRAFELKVIVSHGRAMLGLPWRRTKNASIRSVLLRGLRSRRRHGQSFLGEYLARSHALFDRCSRGQ